MTASTTPSTGAVAAMLILLAGCGRGAAEVPAPEPDGSLCRRVTT
jgi:hypothetical protein